MEVDVVELKKQIIQCFENYKKHYPWVTLNSIAGRIGRNEGTLRNIFDIHKESYPRPDIILNLMMIFLEKRNIHSVIEDAPEIIRQYLYHCFPLYTDKKPRAALKAIEVEDRESFIIIWLCATGRGSTRQEIKNILGQFGEQKLEHLLETEALKINDVGYISTIDENIYLSPETVRKYSSELLKFIKFEESGKGTNLFYAFSESVSAEFQKQAVNILYEAYTKVREHSKLPENAGEIKFFTIVAADNMTIPRGDL